MSFQSGGSGNALWFFVFIIVGIVAVIFLAKNPNFKKWLEAFMKGGIGTAPPPAVTPPSNGPGGGTGTQPSGSGQYPMEVCEGGPSDRAQWCSKHPCLAQTGEETVAYLTITADGDDDVSIKMRGGAHNNDCAESGCCYIVGVSYDGGEHHGIECPHPHSDGDIEGGGALFNPGDLHGKTFGIMARCYPESDHDKLEVWLDADNTGQFTKFWEGTSTRFFGTCNGVSGGCADRGELTFIRLDDVGGYSGASIERAYTSTYAGGGGGTPTGDTSGTTTPPPAAEDEEEEDEEANLARVIMVGNLQ